MHKFVCRGGGHGSILFLSFVCASSSPCVMLEHGSFLFCFLILTSLSFPKTLKKTK